MARISNAPTCASPACAIPRRHKPDCERPDGPDACRGCLPGQAAPGLRLCDVCSDRLEENIAACPQLHEDLAEQLRGQGRGEHTSGSRDRSPSVNGDVVEARERIETLVRSTARLIHTTRGFAIPTRMMVDRRPEGFIGPMQLRPYADTSVRTLCEFIGRSAEWLAADKDAGQLADSFRSATGGKVWALAYPSMPEKAYIGQCPCIVTYIDPETKALTESICDGRLMWDDRKTLIHCPNCEKDETVEWWQRAMHGEVRGKVDTVSAARWLSFRFRHTNPNGVEPSVILNWVSRGKLSCLMAAPEHEGAKPKPIRDERGRNLYDLADVLACYEATRLKKVAVPA